MTRLTSPTHARRGVSLLSTLVGVGIMAVLLLTNAAGLIYSARAARVGSYRLAARAAAQGIIEQAYTRQYDQVTAANYPSVTAADANAPILDSLNGQRAALDIDIEGERQATGASTSSLTCASANWETNRWTGNTVLLTAGRGFGQRATILSNTATTLNISLLGYAQTTWVLQPDATTRFIINGGKTVRVTASFDFQGQTFSETVTGLVVHDD